MNLLRTKSTPPPQRASSNVPNPAASYTHDNFSARLMFEDIPLQDTKSYYKSQARRAISNVDKAFGKRN